MSCDFFSAQRRVSNGCPVNKNAKNDLVVICKAVLSILQFHVAGMDFIVYVQVFLYI